MAGSLGHLARRFFDVLLARPLSVEEQTEIAAWLEPGLAAVFFAQPAADQRHGHHAASVVLATGSPEPVLVRAALVHDVGKRHSRLGVLGRTLATILVRLGLPLFTRARLYRDHGELGAFELEALGAEAVVVAFARSHHHDRDPVIPIDAWTLLQNADQPPKTGTMVRSRII